MPLLVDAFNVLHVTGVLPPELAGVDLDGLSDLIARSRFARDEVLLVCDGAQPRTTPARHGDVLRSWAGAGRSADDLIRGIVERSSAAGRITVVTSDGGIARAVRKRGASVMRSEEFLRLLGADGAAILTKPKRATSAKPDVPLASAEVRRWLGVFGLDESSASLETSDAPKVERPRPASAPTPAKVKRESDELGIDWEAILRAAPPARDGPRTPRATRRGRRK